MKAQYKTDSTHRRATSTDRSLRRNLSMVKEGLKDLELDTKSALRCKNMFALGLVCWLFDRDVDHAEDFINRKFAKKELIRQANIKALNDGYNYEPTHTPVLVRPIKLCISQVASKSQATIWI